MKILIIEDSARLRKSLVKGFQQLGFSTDDTGDGKEGLSFGLNFDYDAIILDIMLPSMDGITILKKLRKSPKNTNVLMLSAKDQVEDRIKGLNFGADDYVCKPFSFDELHARVLTLVRRSHQVKSNAIELGHVKIDIRMKQLFVNSDEVQLTRLEYSIIEQLALNLGRVMSAEQLLEYLHDSSFESSRNAIEAHVSSARKKLKKHGVSSLIETKRGFGYVIKQQCAEAQ